MHFGRKKLLRLSFISSFCRPISFGIPMHSFKKHERKKNELTNLCFDQVMGHCNAVPNYTPVATFFNGQYVSNGGNTGVFLGCIQNGFKVCIAC